MLLLLSCPGPVNGTSNKLELSRLVEVANDDDDDDDDDKSFLVCQVESYKTTASSIVAIAATDVEEKLITSRGQVVTEMIVVAAARD